MGIMRQPDTLQTKANLSHVGYAGKPSRLTLAAAVVVPEQQTNRPAQDAIAVGSRAAVAEVAENPERVTRADSVVDRIDDNGVHLLDGAERTVAVPDDVAVTQMEVSSEEVHAVRSNRSRRVAASRSLRSAEWMSPA